MSDEPAPLPSPRAVRRRHRQMAQLMAQNSDIAPDCLFFREHPERWLRVRRPQPSEWAPFKIVSCLLEGSLVEDADPLMRENTPGFRWVILVTIDAKGSIGQSATQAPFDIDLDELSDRDCFRLLDLNPHSIGVSRVEAAWLNAIRHRQSAHTDAAFHPTPRAPQREGDRDVIQ